MDKITKTKKIEIVSKKFTISDDAFIDILRDKFQHCVRVFLFDMVKHDCGMRGTF